MTITRGFLAVVLLVALVCSISPGQTTNIMSRTGDFSITGAVWLSGDVYLKYYDVDITKNTGFLLRAFYDYYVVEKLSVGLYGNLAPTSWEGGDQTATIYEIGFSIKPRFPVADGAVAIKPGLNVGYRTISSDFEQASKVNAMGLNASVEIQFSPSGVILPYMEIGFLAQPVGGNKYTDVTFPPIFYFGAGVSF